MPTNTKKLLHIEGLRGLAIIFIILFHLCPATFPMGFLGVEVFLAITGYLLFAKPFRQGDETLREASGRFLGKKLKRLYIPLAATVVFTLAVCFCFLTPEDYRLTSITGLFSLAGASNFYLHKILNNYFWADVSFCPLTHTWYLAVVVQVYLLYWVANLVCSKCPRKVCAVALSVVGLLSLAWVNIESIVSFLRCFGYEYHLRATSDYYGTFGRLWEVLAGAGAALLPGIRSGKCRGVLSAAALIVLVFFLAQGAYDIEHPVCMAAVVLCTVILIRYAAGDAVGWLLSLKPLVKVGAVSFSLYLIHFPVIVCYRCLAYANSAAGVCLVLILVAAAGLLFYRCVETRRFGLKASLAIAGAGVALAAVGVASPNAFLWRASDFKASEYVFEYRPASECYGKGFDTSVLVPLYDVEKFTARKKKCNYPLLRIGDTQAQEISFVLMGDSHAAALCTGLDMHCRKHGLGGLYVKTYVVPFSQWEMKSRGWSPRRERALLEWLAGHPELKTVIIAQYWQFRFDYDSCFYAVGTPPLEKEESLRQFVRAIKDMGKQVILVADAPRIKSSSIPRDYRLSCRWASFEPRRQLLNCTWEQYKEYKKVSAGMLQKMEEEGLCRVLHIERALFGETGVFEGVKEGHRYMHDFHHMSPEGAGKAIEGCEKDLLPWLRNEP